MDNVFATVVAGVAVFTLGQIIQKLFIEPIQDQRKIIGEIAFNLTFLQAFPPPEFREALQLPEDPHIASKTLRRLGGQLKATVWTIPAYDMFSKLRILPNRKDISTASSGLIGWANSSERGGGEEHRQAVETALKLTI